MSHFGLLLHPYSQKLLSFWSTSCHIFFTPILLLYAFVKLTLVFSLMDWLSPPLNISTLPELNCEPSGEHNLFFLHLLLLSLKWFMAFVWILSLSKGPSSPTLHHWPLIKIPKTTGHLALCNVPPQCHSIDNNWLGSPHQLFLTSLSFWFSFAVNSHRTLRFFLLLIPIAIFPSFHSLQFPNVLLLLSLIWSTSLYFTLFYNHNCLSFFFHPFHIYLCMNWSNSNIFKLLSHSSNNL